ncbi:uncharacterized protein LOC124275625 [Haliotis rubra]|uniref:uncharacterized protein LOC124275625 n=1 Tax=Haliotis rubra TaxID=36100 RepID=UPI001EE4EB95|nr:uncharacterized protein LOC124275625 [Haliotis rubra]
MTLGRSVCACIVMTFVLTVQGQFDSSAFDWDFESECQKICSDTLKRDGCCPETLCESNQLSNLVLNAGSSLRFEMIHSCPDEAQAELKSLCVDRTRYDVTSDLESLMPVTSDGVTFFNKYCAACYNVSSYYKWSVNISCNAHVNLHTLRTQQEIVNMAISSGYCQVMLQKPAALRLITCMSTSIFEGDDDILINRQVPIKSFIGAGRNQNPSFHVETDTPFSIILSFSDENDDEYELPYDEKGDNSTCSENQWTYNFTDLCFDVHCFQGKTMVGSSCKSLIAEGKGLLYRYSIKLESKYNQQHGHCEMDERLKRHVYEIAERLQTEYFRCEIFPSFTTDGSENYLKAVLMYQITLTKPMDRDVFEERALNLTKEPWNMTCGDSVMQFKVNLVSSSSPEATRALVKSDPGDKLPVSHQTFTINNPEYESYITEENSYINISPVMVCQFVKFNSSQYTLNPTGDIRLTDGNVSLQPHDFDLADGDARVCVDVLTSRYDALTIPKRVNIHGVVRQYLSYVCVILSLVGLATTFTVYMVFPSLRTLPAKNNICLVVNLFLAQSLLQFGVRRTENPTSCAILGILIHFFWLASLLSMNVCCFHMYRVFSSRTLAAMPRHSSLRRLVKYIAYPYTVATIIVTSTITSQYITSNGSSIGYGGRHCYLSSPLLIGLAFALPLGVILLLNGIMFCRAVRSIAQTSLIQREAMAKGRHNLHVYIKLSTLTGLFWIVGILAEVFPLEVLAYLSIILNGSQGVFICIACVFNKRVLHLVGCTGKLPGQTTSSDKPKTRTKSTSANDLK